MKPDPVSFREEFPDAAVVEATLVNSVGVAWFGTQGGFLLSTPNIMKQ